MRLGITSAAGWFAALGMCLTMASAQDEERPPSRRAMSQAAGYKAQFTCSGLFNASKSLEQIAAHELTNIYPDYGPAMARLPDADVDQRRKTVSVTYADDMPPRIAAWRPHLGCASLPPGASDTGLLARSTAKKPRRRASTPWPQGDRLPTDDLPENVDKAMLASAFDGAFAGDFGGVTSAVVVVQDGRLISEQYLEGFDITTSQRTWSVAKSIGATVIGAAVEDGIVAVDQVTGIDQWSADGDPRGTITLANLLHMGSGLDSEPAGNRTDAIYFGGGLVTDHAKGNLLAAVPGERWRYANNDTMLALLTLREAMEDDAAYLRYPFERVLYKIGMLNTHLETDWQGNFILSSQVWTTARDLARLGILYLQDGVWEGERILPEGWADHVATPAPSQPPGADERPSRGYGAQFWLYQGYPGVPDGTYAALGNRGQFVIIVPERNVVIVRRGYDYRGERFDGPAFTGAVLAALE
ncbi:MAG: serine hydrolase [Pseudomonadota bacterium]